MNTRRDSGIAGDFEAFYALQHLRLFGALCIMTRDRHEAEEVMQEAFVRAWERWDRIGRLEDPVGYLHRIAINLVHSRRRRALVAIRRVVRPQPIDGTTAAVEARVDIARGMAVLSAKERSALVLTDLLDHSSEEAAQILGIKAGTVRTLASRARGKIKTEVGEIDEG